MERTKMARIATPQDDEHHSRVKDSKKDWLQASVSSENLQSIMGFLDMRDRFALMRTKKWLMQEPVTTNFTSFCGKCEDCVAKNQHLCKDKDNQQPASFWKSLLKHSRGVDGGSLKEIHLASCDAFSASVLSESAFAKEAFAGLQVLDLNRCNTLGADGVSLLFYDVCAPCLGRRLIDGIVLLACTSWRFWQRFARTCASFTCVTWRLIASPLRRSCATTTRPSASWTCSAVTL